MFTVKIYNKYNELKKVHTTEIMKQDIAMQFIENRFKEKNAKFRKEIKRTNIYNVPYEVNYFLENVI